MNNPIEKDQISDHVRELLASTIVCDMTLPWAPDYENKESALARMYDSGFSFTSLTVSEDRFSLAETMHHLARQRTRFQSECDRFRFVENVRDIREAKQEGKHAIGFHFQGSAMLERNPHMVEVYYRLGIRQMLLAYNQRNSAADGCHERTDAGLSRYGVALVQEMNRVGMIVDATHTGYRSSMELIEVSRAPVFFTHCNARALHDHPRNITDDQIKACAASGGLIGINGLGPFLSETGSATPENFVRHLTYVSELVGTEHVGIGFDFVYYPEQMYAVYRANPDAFPEGYPEPPWEFLPPEGLPEVVQLMYDRGFSEPEIQGILGENYLRVADQIWT